MSKRGLAAALASIKKDADAAELSLDDTEGLPSGSLAVDIVTGVGGFPLRRLTEVAGWEGSSKTTLCLTAAARTQRDGHFVAYLDPEQGLDKTHAKRIGFNWEDESKGLYIAPGSLESTMKIIEQLIETDECKLIIVDSVPGLVPQALLEGALDDTGPIAHQARLLSVYIPKLAKLLNKHDVALVMVNQMRVKINTGFAARYRGASEEQTTGGSVLRFYFSLRLHMKLAKKGVLKRTIAHPLTGKEEEIAVGNLHRVEAIKNKVGAPYREAEFYLRYDTGGVYGIDNITTVALMAIAKDIIKKKSGGHCSFAGTPAFAVVGEEALYQHLFDNRDALQGVCAALGIPIEAL